jgi:lipid II:glycine glycyltransferase (peptidoglycan interpeptide bridge formation enzyme)
MITRILYNEEKDQYQKLANHPVQTWEWGDFQATQGHKIFRLGVFENEKMLSVYTVSFHKIPKTDYSIGTLLRGPSIDQEMINNVAKIAADQKAIFVKFEPDQIQKTYDRNLTSTTNFPDPDFENLRLSPKVAFYPYSYIVDLTQSEEVLLEKMHPKTRYNIRLANRHGVEVRNETSDKAFEVYLKLLFDTTRRQGFYLHSMEYHQTLWKTLKNTGIVNIMTAYYQDIPLSSFMIFTLGDKLYYPYGASSDLHRQVMAPTLLMWEVIKFGLSKKLTSFDMWGALGPDAAPGDQGIGFTRFKQGFGGQLVQFVGTYDLVINPNLYKVYNLVDKYRWKLLRLKASIFRKQ